MWKSSNCVYTLLCSGLCRTGFKSSTQPRNSLGNEGASHSLLAQPAWQGCCEGQAGEEKHICCLELIGRKEDSKHTNRQHRVETGHLDLQKVAGSVK